MRRLVETLTVSTVVIGLVLMIGCREDLIDVTPIDTGVEPSDITVDSATVNGDGVEIEPGESAEAESAEGATGTPEDAQSPDGRRPSRPGSEVDGAQARPEAPSGSAPATTERPERGERTDRADRPARPEGAAPQPRGGFEGGPPGDRGDGAARTPRTADLFEQFDANNDGLLQASEIPEFMRERIMAADTDGDGAVSREELRALRSQFGGPGGGQDVSPQERLTRMMEMLDPDGDGKIRVDQLPERFRERFSEADTNADGYLSVEEVEAALRAMGERRGGGDRPAGGRRGGAPGGE